MYPGKCLARLTGTGNVHVSAVLIIEEKKKNDKKIVLLDISEHTLTFANPPPFQGFRAQAFPVETYLIKYRKYLPALTAKTFPGTRSIPIGEMHSCRDVLFPISPIQCPSSGRGPRRKRLVCRTQLTFTTVDLTKWRSPSQVNKLTTKTTNYTVRFTFYPVGKLTIIFYDHPTNKTRNPKPNPRRHHISI